MDKKQFEAGQVWLTRSGEDEVEIIDVKATHHAYPIRGRFKKRGTTGNWTERGEYYEDRESLSDLMGMVWPVAIQPLTAPKTAADVLAEMAATYRERNAVYGSNYKMVAPMMAVLFPNGVPSELVTTHQFHLFELILVKLSRFAISNLSHVDSIHDLAVYGAMIEAIITEEKPQ